MGTGRLDCFNALNGWHRDSVSKVALAHLNAVMVLSHIEVIAVCGDHHVNSHGCGQHLEVLHVDFTLVLIDVIEGVDKVELRGRNVSVHEQLLHVIVTTLNAQAFALLCGEGHRLGNA